MYTVYCLVIFIFTTLYTFFNSSKHFLMATALANIKAT